MNPPPGRPILIVNDSPTERISAFVDHFLQTFVSLMRSFVKDITHFVKKVQYIGQVPNNTLLVILNVVSLYTNIPHHEALVTVSRLLHAKRSPSLKPSNQDLIRLLTLVLSLNHLESNNTFWTQRGGVAICSKVSPTVANLSVEDFEIKYVYSYHLQTSIWLRYIDDIFLVWSHSREELDTFIQHLNAAHPTLKFTANIHTTLYTTLYTKPTDTHTYLHYTSSSPSPPEKERTILSASAGQTYLHQSRL